MSRPEGVLITDTELATLRERGIALATQYKLEDVASAIREGCVAGALNSLRGLRVDRQATGFHLLLQSTAWSQAVADRLAAVNQMSPVSDRFPPPSFIVGRAPFTFSTRLLAMEEMVRSAAGAANRGRLLAIVHYLASAAVAERLNQMGGAKPFEDQQNGIYHSVAGSLQAFVCAGVIKDQIPGINELGEAFALALHGYAPLERQATGWIAQEVWK